MKVRCGELLQAWLISLLVFLPILAPVTISGAHRDSAWNLLVYVGLSSLLCIAVVRLRMLRWFLLPMALGGLAYSCYVWVVGADIGYFVISALYESNFREATELIKSPTVLKGFLAFAVTAAFMGCLIIRRSRWNWTSRPVWVSRRAVMLVAAMAAISLSSWRGMGNEFSDVYPMRFVRQVSDYLEEVRMVRIEYGALKYQYDGPPPHEEPLTLVLVIGESARAANWSLYGYHRETNPLLRQWIERYPDNTILYRRAFSAGCATRVSVPSMLSVAGAKEFDRFYKYPSVFRVFRAADLRTFAASTQPATGYYESLANMILADAEVSRRVQGSRTPTDDGLLPILEDYLDEDTPVRLIVLQLQGSHLNYADRYPQHYDHFSGDDRVDAYDNSILYTDLILDEVFQRLRERPEPGLVIYASDHGENLNDSGDGNLSHGAKGTTTYEVAIPMVLYFNEAFAKAMPDVADRLRSTSVAIGHHDMISQTFLGLAGLTDQAIYRGEMDLSSTQFTGHPLYYADNPPTIIPYSEVPAARSMFSASRD